MKRTWRRRNYFIKKELQGRFIFSLFFFFVVMSLCFSLVFSFLSSDTLSMVYKNSRLELGKTPLILLKEIMGSLWIVVVFGGISVALASMFLTHRFAGPLYRFEKVLEEMMAGNFRHQIRLRSKDEAKELAEMINRFNSSISSDLEEMRDLAEKIESHLEAAAAGTGGELDQAISAQQKLRAKLHIFKLKNDE